MKTKVKPSRINITGTPVAGQVPKFVDNDTFERWEVWWGWWGWWGGNIVFVSDPIPALWQYTIVTHNLNVTQADVEAGRYNVKITWDEWTYWISSAMMSQNYSYTKSIWSSGTASNSSVHRQTNTLKCDIYLSLTNVRVIIEDMWAVTGWGTPPVQGLTPWLYARINMYS